MGMSEQESATGGTEGDGGAGHAQAARVARRRIDRLLHRSGVPAVVYFAAVVALLLLAPELPRRAELAADAFAALAAGTWCGLNFWLGLSPVAFAGAGLGRSLNLWRRAARLSWRSPGRVGLRGSLVGGKGNQRHRPHGTRDRAR
jgi:hypothetical protein